MSVKAHGRLVLCNRRSHLQDSASQSLSSRNSDWSEISRILKGPEVFAGSRSGFLEERNCCML